MMNQSAQKPTDFFEQTNLLEKIKKETGVDLWELENAVGIFINKCSVKTIQQANSHHESALLKSRERFEAKLKLNELCLKSIEEAETFYDVLGIFKFTTYESPAHKKALEKMLELASDEVALVCLIEKCPDLISSIRIRAIQKIIQLRQG